jgi:hypothetical protein
MRKEFYMKEYDHLETAIINDMPREALRELLELLEKTPIEIHSTQKSQLSLPQVLDAFDNEFLLGDILTPHAEVSLDGKRAFGPDTGDEPERSLAWACIKLLLGSSDYTLKHKIINLLAREQHQLESSTTGSQPFCQVA